MISFVFCFLARKFWSFTERTDLEKWRHYLSEDKVSQHSLTKCLWILLSETVILSSFDLDNKICNNQPGYRIQNWCLSRSENNARKIFVLHETSSVQFSCSVVSDSLQPHELQHPRPPCPSPTPGVYSNSCPLSRWCHPAISSSVIPFSYCPHSLPASGSFPMSQLSTWGGQSIGVSASRSVLPMNIKDWLPLG